MALTAAQLAELLRETQNAYTQTVNAERAQFLAELDAASHTRDTATTPEERDTHRKLVLDMIRDFWRTPEELRPSVADVFKAARVSRARIYQIRDAMYAADLRNTTETIM